MGYESNLNEEGFDLLRLLLLLLLLLLIVVALTVLAVACWDFSCCNARSLNRSLHAVGKLE